MPTSNASHALISCIKCQGTGKLRHFMHIDNGRCFTCAGTGSVTSRPQRARKAQPAPVRARFVVTSIIPEHADEGSAYQYDAPTATEARAWCRAFCRPHAEGLLIEVRDNGDLVATGTVNEAGRIEWGTL